jgi:hypothetical protein
MSPGESTSLEITSFNLTDLNIDALDTRLELTILFPKPTHCTANCPINQICDQNTGCVID